MTHRVTVYARKAARRSRLTLATSQFRVLPDYIIIGSQRSGTSSLHSYLSAHPSVIPALVKEVHFFDRNFERGTGWYRSHFATHAYRAWVGRATGTAPRVGEATPGYIFHPLVPRRVASLLPGARLIALLRNPIDRAYSNYCHRVAQGLETISNFEEAIAREPDRLGADDAGPLNDEAYSASERRLHSYLERGLYADQLQRWFEVFPRESILVETSEELFCDPPAVMTRVHEFLELPPHAIRRYRKLNSLSSGAMSPHTRHKLVQYFRPHNDRLYALLGRDLRWDR
jgi:hypothetical protein